MRIINLLKIRGSGSIPDYLQVRDEQMNLIGYFKIQNWRTGIERCGLNGAEEVLLPLIATLAYGTITSVQV